jgi:hypothetical protein
MADVDLSVTISRTALGLSPLEIASGDDYYIGTQFLGAAVQWERQQTTSQWLDGAVTTSRHRSAVTEQIAVEVTADTLVAVQAAINTLIQAFVQNSFTMTVVAGGATRVYRCEAADYQDLSWTTPRLSGAQGQVLLQVPRQPVALSGGF